MSTAAVLFSAAAVGFSALFALPLSPFSPKGCFHSHLNSQQKKYMLRAKLACTVHALAASLVHRASAVCCARFALTRWCVCISALV